MALNHNSMASLSWKKMKENPILFLPIIILLGLFFLLGIVVFLEIGLITIISSIAGVPEELIFTNFPLAFLTMIFIIADIVLVVGFLAYVFAMQLGMVKEIVDKGKATKAEMFRCGKEHWFSYFKFLIALFVVIEIPNLIMVLARGDSPGTVSYLLMAPLLIYFAILGLILIFAQPIMTSHSVGVIKMVKHSLANMRAGFDHHLKTWLAVFLVNIALLIVSFLVVLLVYISGLWSIRIITALVFLLIILAYIVMVTWMNMYTFHCYHESGLRKGKHLKKI